jgi:hypothetical protein
VLRVITLFREQTKVQAKKYEICEKGCKLFDITTNEPVKTKTEKMNLE